MNEILKTALNTLLDIQDSSGLNKKRDLLLAHKNNQTLQDILYFVFNPYIKTGIGWSKLNKMEYDIVPPEDINQWTIQGVFTYLIHNNTGRDKDIIHILQFINGQEETFKQILCEIFTKNLKLGISTTTIHKVWHNLIPGFGVQLACKWQDNLEYLQGKQVFVTEKLDGNRCIANVNNGKVIFYSRSGKEIEGMDDIANDLLRLPDGYYDGELIAKSFNETQSQTLRKGKKKDLIYNIFDYLTEEEFESQNSVHDYCERRGFLNTIFESYMNLQYVKLLPVIVNIKDFDNNDEETIIDLLDEYTSNGSEGLMLNINSKYQFNRTPDLLKVKKMYTLDLKVIDITEGNGENENAVGALVVDYKGYRVGVGSGLNKEQRIYWFHNPKEIIGKIIEVKCFEESKNKNGDLSLRFPVFVRVRDDKEEVSYD